MFLLCSVSHSLQLSAIGDDEGSISFFIVRFRCEFHCSLDLSKVSIFLSFKLGKISQECRNLFVGYKHPYVCCKYPQRKVLPAHEENCKSKCSHENKCCVLDCTYRETGVVLDGVFNDYAMVKLYENYLENFGAGKYDRWLAVVEKSMKKCLDLGKSVWNFLLKITT